MTIEAYSADAEKELKKLKKKKKAEKKAKAEKKKKAKARLEQKPGKKTKQEKKKAKKKREKAKQKARDGKLAGKSKEASREWAPELQLAVTPVGNGGAAGTRLTMRHWSRLVEPPTIEVRPVPALAGGRAFVPLPRRLPTSTRRATRIRRLLFTWGAIVIVAAGLAFGIRAFFFQAFYVPSASMTPTLQVGDRIVVEKFDFHPSSLRTGDIVVFRTPAAAQRACIADEGDLVKRVIAVPGQTIWSSGNTIYLDGRRLAQPYLARNTSLGRAIPRIFLQPGEYFVLGDNRTVSCDSRYWGPLPGSAIVGRVMVRIWHNGHPDLHLF